MTSKFSFILTVINEPPFFEQDLGVFRIPTNSLNTYNLTTRAVDPEGNTVRIGYSSCIEIIVNCNDPLSFVANTSANDENTTFQLQYSLFDGYHTVYQNLTIEVYNLPPILVENELNVILEVGKSKFLKLKDAIDERPQTLVKQVQHLPPFTAVNLEYNMIFFQVPTAENSIPDQTDSLIIVYNDNYNLPTLLAINVHFINKPPYFNESQFFNKISLNVSQPKWFIPVPEYVDPENLTMTQTLNGCSFCNFYTDPETENNGIQVHLNYSMGNQSLEVTFQINDSYYRANFSFNLEIINQPPKDFGNFEINKNIPVNTIHSILLTGVYESDPDGNIVAFSLGQECPSYVKIVNSSLEISPSFQESPGPRNCSYSLSDGYNIIARTINFTIKNEPPRDYLNQTVIDPISVNKIESHEFDQIAASDPEGNKIIVTLEDNPPFVYVVDQTIKIAPTYSTPNGTYSFFYIHSDDYHAIKNTLTLTVKNDPPEFIVPFTNVVINIKVGHYLHYSMPNSIDPENNTNIIIPPLNMSPFMQYNKTNNAFIFTPPFTEGALNFSQTFQLSDGFHKVPYTFTLRINNTAPRFNSSLLDLQVQAGHQGFYILPDIIDDEGNAQVNFSTDSSFITFNDSTNNISFNPNATETAGNHTITLFLNDGFHSIKHLLALEVINDPPYLNGTLNEFITVLVGSKLSYQLPTPIDPENNEMIFVFPQKLPTFITFDFVTNKFTFEPLFNEGPQSINVSFGLSDSVHQVPFSFTVRVINEQPYFGTFLKEQQIQAGHQGFYILPEIYDNEGNAKANFSAESSFITFNDSSNNISFNPNATVPAGYHIITLFLNDGFHSIKHMLILRVLNEPPLYNGTLLKFIEVPIDSSYLFQIPTPIDPENNRIKITTTGLPFWIEKIGNDEYFASLIIKPTQQLIPDNYSVMINISDGVNNITDNITISAIKKELDFLNSLTDLYCTSKIDCNYFQLPEMKDSQGNKVTVTNVASANNKVQLNESNLIISPNIEPGKYIIELTLSYSGFETVHTIYLYVMKAAQGNLADHSILAYGDQQYSLQSSLPINATVLNVSNISGPDINYIYNNISQTFNFQFSQNQNKLKDNEILSLNISTQEHNTSTNRTSYAFYIQNFLIKLPEYNLNQTPQIISFNMTQGTVHLNFSKDSSKFNRKVISDISKNDIRINIPSRPQKKPIQFENKKNRESIEITINISTIKIISTSTREGINLEKAKRDGENLENVEIIFLKEFKDDDSQQYVFLLKKGFNISFLADLSEVDKINKKNMQGDNEIDEDSGLELSLGAATAAVVGAGYTIFGTNMAGKVIGSFPLAKLWGMLNSLSYLTTLALIGTYVPERQMSVLMSIFNFAQLDALSSDILLESFPGEEASIPYNGHFNQMGFGSRDLVANMQSAFFYLSAYLLLKLLQFLLQKFENSYLLTILKCGTIQRMLQKLDQNFFIRFFIQQYITIYISCVLNLFVVNAEGIGHTFSTITTFIMFPFLIIVPFTLSVLIFWKRNQKITKERKLARRWISKVKRIFLPEKFQLSSRTSVSRIPAKVKRYRSPWARVPRNFRRRFLKIAILQCQKWNSSQLPLITKEFKNSYGSAIDKLKEYSSWALHWNVFLLIKYQLTILILVFLVEIPYLQILLIQLMSIATLVYIVTVWPFTEKLQNIQELVNEILVILFCICQYPLAFISPEIVTANQLTQINDALNITNNSLSQRILQNDIAEEQQSSQVYTLTLTQEIGSWGLVSIVYFSFLFGMIIVINQMLRNYKELKERNNATGIKDLMKQVAEYLKNSIRRGNPQLNNSQSGRLLDQSASSDINNNEAEHISLIPQHSNRVLKQQQSLSKSLSQSGSKVKLETRFKLQNTVSINPLELTRIPADSSLDNIEEEIKIQDNTAAGEKNFDVLNLDNSKYYFKYKERGGANTERIQHTNRSNSSSQTPFNSKFNIFSVQNGMNNQYQQGSRVNFIGNKRYQYNDEEEIKEHVFSEERQRINEAPPRQQSVVSGITFESSAQMLQRNKVSKNFGTTPQGALPHFSSLFFRINQQSSESLQNLEQPAQEQETNSNSSELPQKYQGCLITQMFQPVYNSNHVESAYLDYQVRQEPSFEAEDQETIEQVQQEPPPSQPVHSAVKKSRKGKKRRKAGTGSKKRRLMMGLAYKDGIRSLERTIRWLNQMSSHP